VLPEHPIFWAGFALIGEPEWCRGAGRL